MRQNTRGKSQNTTNKRLQASEAMPQEQTELTEPRERVAELEAEVKKWKEEPWTLEHDYPDGRSRGGRRRGQSKVSEELNELQLDAMLVHIGENTTGPAVIGSILLLIEYVGALAFNKRFNDLDMAIDDIRQGLLNGDYMEEYTAESLRLYTLESADDWITFRVTSDVQRLTENYQKHTDQRSRAKREGSADA